MAYQVLHISKVHGNLGGLQSHFFREHESKTNRDIDKNRTQSNEILIPKENLEKGLKRILAANGIEKVRKNGVKLADILVTCSPEKMKTMTAEEQKKYFSGATDFFKRRFGENNILYAVVHHDEETAHLHLGFVPIDSRGKLNARGILTRKFFQTIQADFNAEVGAAFGLEKGENVKETKRKHLSSIDFKIKQREKKLAKLEEKVAQVDEVKEFKKWISEHHHHDNGVSIMGKSLADAEDTLCFTPAEYAYFDKQIDKLVAGKLAADERCASAENELAIEQDKYAQLDDYCCCVEQQAADFLLAPAEARQIFRDVLPDIMRQLDEQQKAASQSQNQQNVDKNVALTAYDNKTNAPGDWNMLSEFEKEKRMREAADRDDFCR